MKKINLTDCPVCESKLLIKQYACPKCHTSINGEFTTSVFSRLNSEQIDFIKIFLMAQGNIKEVENRLKISYPTVKNKINEINKVFHESDSKTKKDSVISILDEIENGFINVADAIEKISKKKKEK